MEAVKIMVRNVDGAHYECVEGHSLLMSRLSSGIAVGVTDVETGERFKLAMYDGRIQFVHGVNKQIAETIAYRAILKAKGGAR